MNAIDLLTRDHKHLKTLLILDELLELPADSEMRQPKVKVLQANIEHHRSRGREVQEGAQDPVRRGARTARRPDGSG